MCSNGAFVLDPSVSVRTLMLNRHPQILLRMQQSIILSDTPEYYVENQLEAYRDLSGCIC